MIEVNIITTYLFHGSYTIDGIRGLIKEGGSSRRSHFEENVGSLGGKVESFYYAFGGDDIYAQLWIYLMM